MFVEKLRNVKIWFFRCGFADPAFVAMYIDIGHCESFSGETKGVGHEGEEGVRVV